MKKLLIAIAVFVPLTSWAVPVIFQWDANPVEDNVTEYRVYSMDAQGQPTLLGTSTTTQMSADIPEGPGIFVVTAFNGLESAPSDPVSVNIPHKPSGASITVSFTFP